MDEPEFVLGEALDGMNLTVDVKLDGKYVISHVTRVHEGGLVPVFMIPNYTKTVLRNLSDTIDENLQAVIRTIVDERKQNENK